jgi:hypothetical protein
MKQSIDLINETNKGGLINETVDHLINEANKDRLINDQ